VAELARQLVWRGHNEASHQGKSTGQVNWASQLGKSTGQIIWASHLHFCTLEHDPEKWKPVFRKDHAQLQNLKLFPKKWTPVFRERMRHNKKLGWHAQARYDGTSRAC
jgi:hypothetical protein